MRAGMLRARDYYPFRMELPGREYNMQAYRFGFNGKEAERSGVYGNLHHYDYAPRIYTPGIGRFLSVEPPTKSYSWYTPYEFAGNRPIKFIDLDGLEKFNPEDLKDDHID